MIGCLYCLSTGNEFKSNEHVYPESLGNKEVVLPKGIVCDKCNNEILARLDQTLIDFTPIKLRLLFLGIKNKAGNLPSARFRNVHIKRKSAQRIALDFQSKSNNDFEAYGKRFNFSVSGEVMDNKKIRLIARALAKICLGMLHFTHGERLSFDAKYDKVRRFIIGKDSIPGYFLLNERCLLEEGGKVHTKHWLHQNCTIFLLTIYGVQFAFDLEMINRSNEYVLNRHLFNFKKYSYT